MALTLDNLSCADRAVGVRSKAGGKNPSNTSVELGDGELYSTAAERIDRQDAENRYLSPASGRR